MAPRLRQTARVIASYSDDNQRNQMNCSGIATLWAWRTHLHCGQQACDGARRKLQRCQRQAVVLEAGQAGHRGAQQHLQASAQNQRQRHKPCDATAIRITPKLALNCLRYLIFF